MTSEQLRPEQLPSEQLRFDNQAAVVTGSGTGLGRAHALLLAERGAAVVVNDINEEAANSVVAEITESGGKAVACCESVTTEPGAEAIIGTALDEFGRIDVLINNAGLLRSIPFAEFTMDDWNAIVGVSLTGSFLMTRAAWAPMQKQGSGRVLMTTSNSGLLGIPGSAAYSSAKAGLWGLTRTLSIEGKEHGIGVNALAPMAFTAMSSSSKIAPKAWRDGTGDEWSRRLDVRRVAPVAAWLCHDSCPLTGEILSAAAGGVARFFMGLTVGKIYDDVTLEDVRDDLEEILDTTDFTILKAAFQEGRNLHRRILGS